MFSSWMCVCLLTVPLLDHCGQSIDVHEKSPNGFIYLSGTSNVTDRPEICALSLKRASEDLDIYIRFVVRRNIFSFLNIHFFFWQRCYTICGVLVCVCVRACMCVYVYVCVLERGVLMHRVCECRKW